MPTSNGTGRTEMLELIEACHRLAGLQHRLAGGLHTLGLLDDTTHLSNIAHADQLDAHIYQARHALATDSNGSDTAPHRIPRHDTPRG